MPWRRLIPPNQQVDTPKPFSTSSAWRDWIMDFLDPAARSERMSLIRERDTRPEIIVRSYLHNRGLRYRLHDRALPGKPDLVFPSRGVVVFVHGCFWHGHECRIAKLPQSRTEYWLPKIAANKRRDQRNAAKLRRLGWRVLTIRECQLSEARLDRLYKSIVGQ